MKFTVKVDVPEASQIIRRLGLDKNGDAQRFHTNNIKRRITRYMPYRTGTLSTKLKIMSGPDEITVLGPYAKYQYFGKVMVGKAPRVVTDKALDQRPRAPGNDRAGPLWDKRLVASEGEAIAADLQRYINRKE